MKVLEILLLVINIGVSIIFVIGGLVGAGLACGGAGQTSCPQSFIAFVPLAISIVLAVLFFLKKQTRIFQYLFWFVGILNLVMAIGDLLGLRLLPISYFSLFI